MSFQDPELIHEFVVESLEHLSDLESQLLSIEAAGSQIDVELVNQVFRAVHSIKGAAGFLALTTINELSHSLENVLNMVRRNELVPSSSDMDQLLRAADTLRTLIRDIDNSNSYDVGEQVQALDRIATGAADQVSQERFAQERVARERVARERVAREEVSQADVSPAKASPEPCDTEPPVAESPTPGDELAAGSEWCPGLHEASMEAQRATTAEQRPVESPSPADSSSGPSEPRSQPEGAEWDPEAASEVAPARRAAPMQSPPTPVWGATGGDAERAERVSEPTSAEPPMTVRPTAEGGNNSTTAGNSGTDTNIRVSVGVLDQLMNLAGELVLSRNRLLQAVNCEQHSGLESIAARLDQVTSELQESIMQTRMQPIGNVLNRFRRVVRDLSNKLGKRCELTIDGQDVEVDKTIIEAIGDPLTHLVRNSVDHGIETPGERQAAKKSPEGKIGLRAYHQAGKVLVDIVDDGAGIDAERLKEKALAAGLFNRERIQQMSHREALRLIFHPGLSTVQDVTVLSGRGVGMDVVRTNIEKLGGTVEVESERGRGTRIHITLPLTLAIIPSLIVRSGQDRFAVPQVNIAELVRIRRSEWTQRVGRVNDAEVIRLRGSLLPLIRLDVALGLDRGDEPARVGSSKPSEVPDAKTADSSDVGEETAMNVIVVESGRSRYGLVVDGLNDSEEIVVKPLGCHLKRCQCLAGATILGDGHVALILDVSGISAQQQLRIADEAEMLERSADPGKAVTQTHPVLLLEAGSGDQFAVPMGVIARLERIHSEQVDSVGGQQLLQYRGGSLPLMELERIIHLDPVEEQRPRLHVVVFEVANREVGLITQQLVDIRNISTHMDPMTLREPGVIGSQVIDDKTVRLLDLYELARAAYPTWFSAGSSDTSKPSGAEKNARILLVEDSDFFRQRVQNYLQEEGYQIVACEDGQIAWETLQQDPNAIDLVVTDIEMPNMDGFELCIQIKQSEAHRHLPVVALTSLARDDDVQKGMRCGMADYLVKMDREKLVQAVASHLTGNDTSSPLDRSRCVGSYS